MSNSSNSNNNLPTPHLVKTANPIPLDRRLLINIIVIPYTLTIIASFFVVIFFDIEEARITLASSALLSPLGTLAGVIVAFYFKSSD